MTQNTAFKLKFLDKKKPWEVLQNFWNLDFLRSQVGLITIAAEFIRITVELYYNHGVRGLIANAAFEVMKSWNSSQRPLL